MASEQSQLDILIGFRKKIEVYTPRFTDLLNQFRTISLSIQGNTVDASVSNDHLPSPEKIIQTIVASKTILPGSASVIRNAITQQGFFDRSLTRDQFEKTQTTLRGFYASINLHEIDDFIDNELEQQKFIEDDPALRLSLAFIRNPEVRDAAEVFHTLTNSEDKPTPALHFAYVYFYFLFLFSYLWISATHLDEEINTLTEAEKRQKQKEEWESKKKTGQSKEKEESTILSDVEKERQKIRKKQQSSVELAKQIFIAHQERMTQVRGFLSPSKELRDVDIDNLLRMYMDAGITNIDVDTFFLLPEVQEIITQHVGAENIEALSLLKQQFLSLRQAMLQSYQDVGVTKVLGGDKNEAILAQQTISEVSKMGGRQLPALAYTMTGSELRALETSSDNELRQSATVARQAREQAITTLWAPKPGVSGLLERASGGLAQRRQLLVEEWGLVEREKPKNVSDFILLTDGLSFADLFGTAPEKIPTEESITEERQGEVGKPGIPNPAKIKQNAERLKTGLQVSKTVLTNPYVLGGAAIGGGIAYGFLTQGIAGGAGVISSTIGGAGIGAALGTWVFPGVGTLAGAFIGAVGGTIGGVVGLSIPAGSTSATAAVGNFTLNTLSGGQWVAQSALPAATSTAQATLAAAAPTAQAGISGGISAAASAANTGLAATQTLLHSLQTLPSALASLPASTAIVAGPMAVAGIITVTVVVPTIIGSFLSPDRSMLLENKYVTLNKIASANGSAFIHSDHPQTITYTISIKAKSGYTITLTDVSDKEVTSSKGKPKSRNELYNPQPDLDKIKNSPITDTQKNTIVTYTVPYDASYEDTRVNNAIKITFNVSGTETSTNQTLSTSSSIAFGNPPADMGCFVFETAQPVSTAMGIVDSKEWTESEKQIIQEAFSITAPYQHYLDLLCHMNGQEVPIKLYRFDGYSFGGWTLSNSSMAIYDLSFGSENGVAYPHDVAVIESRYTIIHESGHVIIHRDASSLQTYFASNSSLIPTYGYYGQPGTAPSDQESFAETIAVFTLFHHRQFRINGTFQPFDMPSRVPNNYMWVKNEIFQGDPP